MLLGLGLSLVAIVTDPQLNLSRWNLYNEIELGMGRDQVELILERGGVTCGITEPPVPRTNACHFSDLWRGYQILINKDTGAVAIKTFGLIA